MSTPEDENTPRPAEGGDQTGAVPPASEPTTPAEPATTPAPPATPVGDAPPAPPVTPEPPAPAAPAGGYPAAPPPPPGAFPAYGAAPVVPVERPTSIPTTVNTAFWLYIASALLSVISGIITISTVSRDHAAIVRQLQRSGADLHGQNIDTVANAALGVAIGFSVLTLIFWAVTFVLFAFFMRRGANWARIVLTVLTALSLLNVLNGLGTGALQVILSIVALILMWLRPSSEWFAAIKASKALRA